MREILGVLVFLSIGVIIMAAAAWYIDIVLQWWRSSSGPPAIGSVTVLGPEDANAKAISGALPGMILAGLRQLGGQTNEAKRQLRELGQTQPGWVAPADESFPSPHRHLEEIAVPEGLKTDVAIPDTIAGVQIGWLFKLLKNVLEPTNVIDLTAIFDRDGSKATVIGHAKGKNSYAFDIEEASGRPDDVALTAAASIIQLQQRRGEIVVQPLSGTDYRHVVNALANFATYERLIRSWVGPQGRPDYTDEYKKQLEIIAPIAERHTQWSELQWLASEIAEGAGDLNNARSFASREQRLTPPGDRLRHAQVADRLKYLMKKETAIVQTAPPDSGRAQARAAASGLPDAELLAPIRDLLAAEDVPDRSSVRIAVIGPTPWEEARKGATVQSLDSELQVTSDEMLINYTTALMQTTRVLAPSAVYQFVNVPSHNGGLAKSEIGNALTTIAKTDKLPDVLLFTYSPPDSKLNSILRELGRVDIHRVARTDPTRCIIAEKLVSVLS
jgi:hypothetical protein